MFFPDINDMEDIGLRSLSQSQWCLSLIVQLPISTIKKNILVAILSLDWVFSEIPSQYLKKGR